MPTANLMAGADKHLTLIFGGSWRYPGPMIEAELAAAPVVQVFLKMIITDSASGTTQFCIFARLYNFYENTVHGDLCVIS